VLFASLAAAVAANGGRLPGGEELARLKGTAPSAQVRVISIAGPVVAAGTPAHHAVNAHPATDVATTTQAPLSFAEREHILEHPTTLPPPVHAATPARANAFVPPQFPAESAPQPVYAPPLKAHNEAHDNVANAPGSAAPAAPLPVYHPPNDTPSATSSDSHPAAPVYHAPAAAPGTHTAPPPAAPKSARDSAAHADRDSRERVVR
jgi:hypothetical protein